MRKAEEELLGVWERGAKGHRVYKPWRHKPLNQLNLCLLAEGSVPHQIWKPPSLIGYHSSNFWLEWQVAACRVIGRPFIPSVIGVVSQCRCRLLWCLLMDKVFPLWREQLFRRWAWEYTYLWWKGLLIYLTGVVIDPVKNSQWIAACYLCFERELEQFGSLIGWNKQGAVRH